MADDVFQALQRLRSWKLAGGGQRAHFTASTWDERGRWSQVTLRRRKGETVEALLWRGVGEVNRRLREGMPKPDPRVVARRKLRAAKPASQAVN